MSETKSENNKYKNIQGKISIRVDYQVYEKLSAYDSSRVVWDYRVDISNSTFYSGMEFRTYEEAIAQLFTRFR